MSSATLIIPQHGQADLTIALIASIRRCESKPWPILVVDDGSPDVSEDAVRSAIETERLSDVTVLQRPHKGLTAAWNAAAGFATTSRLVFLNNDITASGPFIERLLAPLEAHGAAMTGVRLRNEARLPPQLLARLPTQRFLEGWCFALRRADFEQLGGFDESMRLYWSDTDLQCRLVKKSPSPELSLVAIPDLPLTHLAHRTTRRSTASRDQWRADRSVFIQKWSREGAASLKRLERRMGP